MLKWIVLIMILIVVVGIYFSLQGPKPDYPPNEKDLDGDGLENSLEELLGTNPNVADTDGDGFQDFAEVRAKTNALDKNSYPGKQSGNIPSNEEINLDKSSSAYIVGKQGDNQDFILNGNQHNIEFTLVKPDGTKIKLQSKTLEVWLPNQKVVEVKLDGYILFLFVVITNNQAELIITNLGKIETSVERDYPNYQTPEIKFGIPNGAILFGLSKVYFSVKHPEYVKKIDFYLGDIPMVGLENKHLYGNLYAYLDTTSVLNGDYELKAVMKDVKGNQFEEKINISINQSHEAENMSYNSEQNSTDINSICIPTNISINNTGETAYRYFQLGIDNKDKAKLGLDKSDPKDIKYGVEITAHVNGNFDYCTSKQLTRGTRTKVGDIKGVTKDDEGNIKIRILRDQKFNIDANDFPELPGIGGRCPYEGDIYCNDDYQIENPRGDRSMAIGKENNTIFWYDQPKSSYGKGNLTWNDAFISYVKGTDGTYCWIKWELNGEYDEENDPIIELHPEITQEGTCSNNTEEIPQEIKEYEKRSS